MRAVLRPIQYGFCGVLERRGRECDTLTIVERRRGRELADVCMYEERRVTGDAVAVVMQSDRSRNFNVPYWQNGLIGAW